MERKFPVIDVKKTGRKIKRIMNFKGLTVKDIQSFLELSTPQSIYHWFDGRNLPTLDNLYALSELFHLPIDSLIAGSREYVFEYTGYKRNRIFLYFESLYDLKLN